MINKNKASIKKDAMTGAYDLFVCQFDWEFIMKKYHLFGLSALTVAMLLTGCSSGGKLAEAIVPNKPTVKGHYTALKVDSDHESDGGLLPDNQSKITITDDSKQESEKIKTYSKGQSIDIANKYLDKVTALPYEMVYEDQVKEGGNLLIYKQNNSVASMLEPTYRKFPDGTNMKNLDNAWRGVSVQGNRTSESNITANINKKAKITYEGQAFTGSDNQSGKLRYTIDFENKTGSGSITNLKGEKLQDGIHLEKSSLQKDRLGHHGIQGKTRVGAEAQERGSYSLGIFGSNAEEIAGIATVDTTTVGFAGKETSRTQ